MRGVFVRVGALEGGDNSYVGQMMKIATNTQNSGLIRQKLQILLRRQRTTEGR